jgi:riboflavin kinase/FMN adenylyltransferase
MQLIRRPGRDRQCLPNGSAVTIGTFDGVHLGHQAIIARVREKAQALGAASVVFSFEPTPTEFFRRDDPPPRLTRFREKFAALSACGVDCFFCPPFNAEMEKLTPDQFIDQLLIAALGARHVVVGDDFRFAHRRAGRYEDLLAAGERLGFTVERVGSVLEQGQRVSSTEIRRALGAGEMERARQLLGRWYRITGRVVPGRQLGRKLGYPTANLRLARHTVALTGIFAVRVSGLGSSPRNGVASLGYRPTVEGGDTEPLLEIHLFDFDEDIYGQVIDVDFIEHLRPEEKFSDLDALTRQMHDDADRARTILAQPDLPA